MTQAVIGVVLLAATPLVAGVVSVIVGRDAPITYPVRVALAYSAIMLSASVHPNWYSAATLATKLTSWLFGSLVGVVTFHVVGLLWTVAFLIGVDRALENAELPVGLLLVLGALGAILPPVCAVAVAWWCAKRIGTRARLHRG